MRKLPRTSVFGPLLVALVATLLLVSGSARALAPASARVEATRTEAPVMLFNRRIAVLRSAFLGVPPAERAVHTGQRLAQILDHLGPGKITISPAAGANAVLVDGALALFLTPEDANVLDGETLDQASQSAARELARAIAETREARDRDRLWRAIVASSIATLALLLFMLVVLRARTWLERRFLAILRGSTARMSAGKRLLYVERLLWIFHWLMQAAATCLVVLGVYRWLSFVLNRFPYTRPWGEQLDGFLLGAAADLGNGMVYALPDIAVALFIFFLARAVIVIVRPLFDGIEQRRVESGWLDADTAKPTRRLFSLAVWLCAIVMAYPYLPGSSSEAFKGVSVLVGLMVTLGGSSLFGQAASGLILLYSRTLRLGEFVRVGEHEGTVTELGVFTTRIATGRGEDVTLPNAFVLTTVTKNYSRPTRGDGFMLRTKVTIGYDTPWRQVEAMLLEAAHATDGVTREPAARVYQTGLSDFYVEYELVAHATQVLPDERANALAALNANVIDTFNRYGVQIMSPHYLADPAKPKTVPVQAWHQAPATAEATRGDGTAD